MSKTDIPRSVLDPVAKQFKKQGCDFHRARAASLIFGLRNDGWVIVRGRRAVVVFWGFVASLLAAVVAITVMLLAPCARADPASDDHFIAMLENAGLNYLTERQVVIDDGHNVCFGLWSGSTTTDMENQLLSVSPMLSPLEAHTFVSIAAQAFCPDIGARYKTRD